MKPSLICHGRAKICLYPSAAACLLYPFLNCCKGMLLIGLSAWQYVPFGLFLHNGM